MSVEFNLPELGENIESIQVVRVMVAVGDSVAVDQPVAELETDKATIEVPSSVAGTVADVHVAEGDEITVGQLLLTLEGEDAAPVEAPAPIAKEKPATAPEPIKETPVLAAAPDAPTSEIVFNLPELGENIESIQVVRIMVAVGDEVAKDQPVVELETDKATIEAPSDLVGKVTEIHIAEGDEISVGQPLFTAATAGAPAPAAPAQPTPTPEPVAKAEAPATAPAPAPAPSAALAASVPSPECKQVAAAPSVRKFAREIGIVLSEVPGTGPNGRVSKDDVKRYAKQLNEGRATQAQAVGIPAATALPPLPDFSQWGEVEAKKMSVIRYKTAEHMALSWSQAPHVTIQDKADITELEALRKQYADLASKEGGKLTMAVMVCKVVAQALVKFPVFNASVDMASKQIIYKSYVNLGVAVSTPRGLMVPVIRDADQKNMVQLAAEIKEIAVACRDGKIQVQDLAGGTFTVTNLGRICGTHFTPIINYPEVAILGMGRSYEEPLVVNGDISKRTVLPLSLSFDHRVIDGSDGAMFMGWIKEAIQQPLMLALDG